MSRRGRGRASNTSPDFLWVNRTPDSDRLSATREEQDEVRSITTHARQWRAALRRQQRLYSAQTQATNAQGIVGWRRQGTFSETSSGGTSTAPSPAAMTQVSGNSTDPFIHLESPDDTWWSHNAFRYAVESWLPSVFQDLEVLDESLPASEACRATSDRIIRGCLENRMHMFSLLAASSGFMKLILKVQLDKHDTPEYCMGQALRHLRYHLAASEPQVDESLVFDLKALSTFERYVSNFEGARAHLRMVQHLVHSMGGLDVLEPPMRYICWLWDLLIAGGTGEPPLMPLTWDPGPLSQDRMDLEISPGLAQGGIRPSGVGLLEYLPIARQDLAPIIIDVVQWFQVPQYSHINDSDRAPIEQWITRRSYALVHRLLSLPPAEQGFEGIFSESIKQSILIVIADVELARRSRANTSLARDSTTRSWSDVNRLRRALSSFIQTTEDWQDRHEEVVLWMACLGMQQTAVIMSGIEASQSTPTGSVDDSAHSWFLNLARSIVFDRRRSGNLPIAPVTSEDLLQIMGRYLHRCDPSGQPRIDGLEELLAP